MPRLKDGDLENVSRLCKARTGVGCDGFHPKVHLNLTKETRREAVEFSEKRWSRVGNGRNKLAQRCSFWILEKVTSERPIALMPTLIRWWEALRAPEVAKWQQKCRDGRNGGAQRTVWEVLMETERFKYRAGEEDVGAVASWCWTWRRHSSGSVSL